MTPLIDVQWKMLRAPEMTQASRQATYTKHSRTETQGYGKYYYSAAD
jgi:hypothetical protein